MVSGEQSLLDFLPQTVLRDIAIADSNGANELAGADLFYGGGFSQLLGLTAHMALFLYRSMDS